MNEERLLLRALEYADIDFIKELENGDFGNGYSEQVAPLSAVKIERYISGCSGDPFRDGELRLMVTYGNGKPLGLLDYYDISLYHRRAMVALILHPDFRGLGLGKRLLNMAVGFARSRLKLQTLGALVSNRNEISLGTFRTVGFSEKGKLEKWWYGNEEFEDCILFQIQCSLKS